MNSRTHFYLTSLISVAGTAFPSGAPVFNLGVSAVRVARYFVFCIVFCRSLFIRWAFFLLTIVLSVLVRFTTSDYLFSIFKLFSVKDVTKYVCLHYVVECFISCYW